MCFKTPYEFKTPSIGRCGKHRQYKVMRPPTAQCSHCVQLWNERHRVNRVMMKEDQLEFGA